MQSIIRDVRDINVSDRPAIEHIVGQRLRDDQRLIIQLTQIDSSIDHTSADSSPLKLPDWCDVYAGLSDGEIAEVEKIALKRADLSRQSE